MSSMEDDLVEINEEDDVFNYKFLMGKNGTKTSDTNSGALKVGEKDFEPDNTQFQANKLAEAQGILYDILSSDTKLHEKNLLQGVYIPERQETLILDVRGNFFRDFGVNGGVFNGKPIMILNKLESLYLLERGSMMIYLKSEKFLHYLNGFIHQFNVNELYLLNLQHFYSFFNAFELKKYQVFSYLKRLGYLVKEYEKFKPQSYVETSSVWNTVIQFFWGKSKIYDLGFQDFTHQHNISYNAILRDLILIPSYSTFESVNQDLSSSLEIHFNVWKPRLKFSKKSLPTPDFHICIVEDFPGVRDIHYLFNQLNYDCNREIDAPKNPKTNHKYDKLKTGTGRSVIVATIDNGVNFINLAEVDFKQRVDGKINGFIH